MDTPNQSPIKIIISAVQKRQSSVSIIIITAHTPPKCVQKVVFSNNKEHFKKALKSQVKGDRVIQGEGLFFKDQVLVLKCLKVFQDLQQECKHDLHLCTPDPTYLLWDLKAGTDSVRSAWAGKVSGLPRICSGFPIPGGTARREGKKSTAEPWLDDSCQTHTKGEKLIDNPLRWVRNTFNGRSASSW